MMRPTIEDDDDDNSSSSSCSNNTTDNENSDLFSPVQGRRTSLHDFLTPNTPASRDTPPPIESLPQLQDKSWIGAKVSPIPTKSDDDDDDDKVKEVKQQQQEEKENIDAIQIMAPKFRGRITSQNRATEQTTLLGQQQQRHGNAIHHRNKRRDPYPKSAFTYTYPSESYPPTDPLEEGTNVTSQNNLSHPSNRILRQPWKFPHIFPRRRRQQQQQQPLLPIPSSSRYSYYMILPILTAMFLGLVALHDVFFVYVSLRRGVTTTSNLAWSIPWLGPTPRSMLRFGAFCPTTIFQEWEYWRILTGGVWVTSSTTEWAILWLAWKYAIFNVVHQSMQQKQQQKPQLKDRQPSGDGTIRELLHWMQDPNHSHWSGSHDTRTTTTTLNPTPWQLAWPIVYVLSVLTGQLWMIVFHDKSYYIMIMGQTYRNNNNDNSIPLVSGCTGWGTAGVLCATGMQWPSQRLELFVLAIALILINLFQPNTASVFGAIGATFWGWAYAGIWTNGSSDNKNNHNKGTTTSWYNSIEEGYTEVQRKPDHNRDWTWTQILAAIIAVSLWLVPAVVCWRVYQKIDS
jgi:hypothetical protein